MNEIKIVYLNNRMVRMLTTGDTSLIIATDICSNPSQLFAKYDASEKCMVEIPVDYAQVKDGIAASYTIPHAIAASYTNPKLTRMQKVLALTEKGFSRYVISGRSAWTRTLKEWFYTAKPMQQPPARPEPIQPEMIRSDIDRLWQAFDKATELRERLAILKLMGVLHAGRTEASRSLSTARLRAASATEAAADRLEPALIFADLLAGLTAGKLSRDWFRSVFRLKLDIKHYELSISPRVFVELKLFAPARYGEMIVSELKYSLEATEEWVPGKHNARLVLHPGKDKVCMNVWLFKVVTGGLLPVCQWLEQAASAPTA